MNIETEYERVRSQVGRPSTDEEVARKVLERLDWIRNYEYSVIDMDYMEWLRKYVRSKAMEVDNKKKLCGCPAKRCELKKGLLPHVEGGDDIDEFIAEHRTPRVLVEARSEWEKMNKKVSLVLDRSRVALEREDASVLPDKSVVVE